MNRVWNLSSWLGIVGLALGLLIAPTTAAFQDDSNATGDDPAASESQTSDADDLDESEVDEESDGEGEGTEGESKSRRFDRQDSEILKALEPIKASAEAVTVAVLSANRKIALGTIVDGEGLILTKASELKGDLFCKLSDGRVLSAEVFGIHQATDLAMLKVAATGLPTARWSDAEPPAVGYWLVTPRPDQLPSLGIVSVQPRIIRAAAGFMGVNLQQAENGVRVDRVIPDSPAENSGVQVNDVIIKLNGEEKTDQIDLVTSVQQHFAGDVIELTVLRDDKEITFKIKLADRASVDRSPDRSNFQNEMGGRLSKRRQGFPMAIQHDTTLSPSECGGPVVDLDGDIVGLNIARAGRVDSLALPASTVVSAIESLKSGNLAPAILYKIEIEEMIQRLAEIEAEMAALPGKSETLASDLADQKIREEELEAVIDNLQNRLNDIKARRSSLENELQTAQSGQEALQKEKERLERDLRRLRTGTN